MAAPEENRARAARIELAVRLHECLAHALAAGLASEAALIARLIEATLTNTATELYLKLVSK